MRLPPTATTMNMYAQGRCNYERVQRELCIQVEMFIGCSVPQQCTSTQQPSIARGLPTEGNFRLTLFPRAELYTHSLGDEVTACGVHKISMQESPAACFLVAV